MEDGCEIQITSEATMKAFVHRVRSSALLFGSLALTTLGACSAHEVGTAQGAEGSNDEDIVSGSAQGADEGVIDQAAEAERDVAAHGPSLPDAFAEPESTLADCA